MTDYTQWKEKTVQVTMLRLDPGNPRIPSGGAALDQRELIAELVNHDNVYELARDIVEIGYYPLESLIGLEDGGKTYILEGNRRLAALKLLISPELAPENTVRKFRNLSGGIAVDQIKKVRVLFAPSRRAAAPIIMQKHTRQQIERWSPLMQARFYRSLIDSGVALSEVTRQYGTTASVIAEFLRTDAMYEVACSMDLPKEVRKVVNNPREFPAAVLQRLLDVPKTREFLGVEFGDNGELRGKVHPDEFRKGYARILTDIAQKKVDTRKLNKAKDIESYLDSLGADTPNKRRRASFTAGDLLKRDSAADEDTSAAPVAAGPSKPVARISRTVIPPSLKCRVTNTRIKEIFNELRRLRIDQYPNACAVLLRILLELSIGHYLDRTGKITSVLEGLSTKNKRPPDWYPSLRQLLNAMLQDPDLAILPLARKRLNKLVSQQDSALSLDDLDGFVHNRFVTPSERELRGLFEALEGIFNIVLDEPPPPAKPRARGVK